MNYHIITQDNFFEAYIEDIYKLHQENNNIFLIRGGVGNTPWDQTKRNIEYLGDDVASIISRLKMLSHEDKLFVSWYDMFIGQAILDSGINCDLYVFVMGGDFYAEPFWYHAKWLFDKYTYKYVKKVCGYPKINWKRKPKNWGKVIDDILNLLTFNSQQQKLFNQKLQMVRRINYIVLPNAAEPEYQTICKLYPGTSFKYVYGSFIQNYDAASILPTKTFLREESLNILIGNSADFTNNYIDAFRWMRKQCKRNSHNFKIYSVLAYGNLQHRTDVIKKGYESFGDSFIPITSCMSREEYIMFLSTMDVIIMYHNRQQACGNIMTSITLGKPVLMKNQSPIYQMLKQQECDSVYDVADVSFNNIEAMIESAALNRTKNMAIVKKIYSEEVRLDNWKHLLNIQA